MAKEKDFTFEIVLKFGQICTATTEKKARQQLDETFFEEYGITLDDSEVKLLTK